MTARSNATPLDDLPVEVFEALAATALLMAAGYAQEDIFVGTQPDGDVKRGIIGVRPPGTPKSAIRWVGISWTILSDENFRAAEASGVARYNALSQADRQRLIDASAIRRDAARLIAALVANGVPPLRRTTT